MSFIDEFVKIDLHIHSEASKTKTGDEKLVKGMNKEKAEVLLKKLHDNDVNLFAITDHNTFDYDLYEKLNEIIETKKYSNIKNVLPAVEFDLEFDPDFYKAAGQTIIKDENSEVENKIHVIAIFSDDDNNDLRNLTRNLGNYTMINWIFFIKKRLTMG